MHIMENLRIEKADDMIEYQEITCHIINDLKIDLSWKAQIVAIGEGMEAPAFLTYSSIVTKSGIKLAFLIVALNDLDIMSCNIGNIFVTGEILVKSSSLIWGASR